MSWLQNTERWAMLADAAATMAVPPGALWIGAPHPFDLHEVYLCFRTPLPLSSAAGARPILLHLTADSRYKLWINGRFVARGPARCWPTSQAVDILDISAYVTAGDNQLAIQLYQPGYSHFAYLHRGMAGLLAWVVGADETLLVSNEAWRVQRDPCLAEDVPRISIYGSGVEVHDMRQALPWHGRAFDDREWMAARIVARPYDIPWTGLHFRSVPHLTERYHPLTLIEARQGYYPNEHDDPHLVLREGWFSAVANVAVAACDADGWFTVALRPGETALWLFDLGRDYTCQGVLDIEGAAGGEICAVSYAEKMREGELVLPDPATYCRLRPTDRFILRPGGQRCATFALRGGRYLLFQLLAPKGGDLRVRPRAVVAEYPLGLSRPLPTTDPTLLAISEMCETTFRACLQDGFVDCVWRESSQWLGDALPQSYLLRTLSDDLRPLHQIITQAAEGAYLDGTLPSVFPAEVHAYTIVAYSLMWLELVTLYWEATANRPLLASLWPTIEKLVEGVWQSKDLESGLLVSPLGRRFYIDWAPLSQAQPHAVFNLHAVRGLKFASGLARALGQGERAADWEERGAALQKRIRRLYWRDGRLYDDLAGTTFSQLGAALAMLTGTVAAESWPTLGAQITARSLDLRDEPLPGEMVLASPFMHHYLFEALRHIGQEAAVIDIIKLRWGRWVAQGYPTTWENWNVDFPDGSQCHAFAAHPCYHLHEIHKIKPGLLQAAIEKEL